MKKYTLLLILILGLFLRLININQSFWLDEASQAQQSLMSLHDIWFNREIDFHPPLFYFLSHFWLLINKSESWARLLPISFGLLNILVIYTFAKKIIPTHASLPAFFLSIAPFHVYYSQEFRSYSLLCLLATLSMYFLYQKKYFLLSLTNALLFYTHYSSAFLLFGQITYVLLYSKTQLKQVALSLVLTLVLFTPWIPQFSKQLQSGANIDEFLPGWRSVLSITPLKAFPVILFKLVAGRISFLSRYLYGIYILFIFAVSFSAFIISRHTSKKLFTIWLIVPFIAMITSSLAIPQSQPFRIIYILPSIIFLFSFAAIRFPKTFITLIIYISLVGNIAYFTRPRLQREQWRQAVTFLKSQDAPSLVKFSAPFAPILWYDSKLNTIPIVPSFPAKSEEVAQKLKPILVNLNKFFLFEYLTDLTDPSRIVDSQLTNSGFTIKRIHNFEGVGFIYEYSKIVE